MNNIYCFLLVFAKYPTKNNSCIQRTIKLQLFFDLSFFFHCIFRGDNKFSNFISAFVDAFDILDLLT